ncbi:sulfur carrier protein ThiS [Cellulosilyticum sp. I15G10I2]|uniref:sulfur carrier protein ThiS n=1 Tax=Cellulosilyticum sp. I15G10I2 TaxID=1892843 RepID=UPI00085C2FDD|nr:sulfur carrier protein ThiS [Cellulosilyticum sp. I15G10I2]
MKVNGTLITLEKNQTLLDFLNAHNYDITKIAVIHNDNIVPKATYKDITLDDEDTLEIVRFVGGG